MAEESDAVTQIRAAPAQFLHRLSDRGVAAPLEDLLCHSVMEVVRSQAQGTIEVTVLGPYEARVRDNGRGVGLFPEPGHDASHAEVAFTQFYPVPPPDPETGRRLRAWAWGDRDSLGPVVANALASSLRLFSQRSDQRSCLAFAEGRVLGPASLVPASTRGTELHVAFAEALFPSLPGLDVDLLRARCRELEAVFPKVEFRVVAA